INRRAVQEDAAGLRQHQLDLTTNQLRILPDTVADRHLSGTFRPGFACRETDAFPHAQAQGTDNSSSYGRDIPHVSARQIHPFQR
ncbi:hypothetical protein KW732_003501, partial [Salmonella enterica]|nr:hypothetical protein [Salmonella enterica]